MIEELKIAVTQRLYCLDLQNIGTFLMVGKGQPPLRPAKDEAVAFSVSL